MVLEGQVTILKIRTGSDTRTGSRNFGRIKQRNGKCVSKVDAI